jgi:hypothetical protein
MTEPEMFTTEWRATEDQRINDSIDAAFKADDEADARKWATITDALDLVAELWPKPGYATVILESHQWARLRRVLLAVPELGDLP